MIAVFYLSLSNSVIISQATLPVPVVLIYFISSQKLLAHIECFSRSIIRETALETLEEITNNARANGRVITSTEQHHAVFRSILKAFDMLADASEDGSSAFLPGPNAIGGSKFSDFIDQQDLIPIEANLH